MATPDYTALLGTIWGNWLEDGGGNANASGIIVGTNPAYSSADFLSMFPNFGAAGLNIPTPVMNAYISLASGSLAQARYCDMWQMVMGLFIAHYLTLWLQTQQTTPNANAMQVAASGLALGIKTSKSAGDVSLGMQPLTDLEGFGAFQLTAYGQQFATIAKTIGSLPMFIL